MLLLDLLPELTARLWSIDGEGWDRRFHDLLLSGVILPRDKKYGMVFFSKYGQKVKKYGHFFLLFFGIFWAIFANLGMFLLAYVRTIIKVSINQLHGYMLPLSPHPPYFNRPTKLDNFCVKSSIFLKKCAGGAFKVGG